MNHPDPRLLPCDLQVSKFRFYSLGVVAANKAMSSNVIEVTPTEELAFSDGDVNSAEVDSDAKGVDANGAHYTETTTTGNTIQATWLPLQCVNRRTSPDVRRGERVIIYQFGDTDKYYWTTLMDDFKLRKLETVIWGISATTEESAEPGHDNMYYLEISSHNKMIALHTSTANGEAVGFDIQINTKDGRLTIQDTVGQEFFLDSIARQLYMRNADGSIVEINKEVCNIQTPTEVNLKTKTWNVDVETANIKTTTTNLSGEVNVSGSALNVTSSNIKLD